MLYSYAKSNGYKVNFESTAIDKFSDGLQVSPWAREALNWAVTQGVVSGKGSSDDISTYRIDPQGNATRAECAAMVTKLLVSDKE